jgi:phosphotransferase system HPr (HPr) family protein
MKLSQVQIRWKEGLHLRRAARLACAAQAFRSTVVLKCGGKIADARSIMSVLLLAAGMSAVVDIETTGEDEANASQAIERIFTSDDDDGTAEPTPD